MSDTPRDGNILLDCNLNGAPVVLPWSEAWEKLWACEIGWVRPQHWLRHRILGREIARTLRRSERSGALFGFRMMTRRRNSPFTIAHMAEFDEDRRMPSRNVFNAAARRFAEIFDKDIRQENRPFEYADIVGPDGRSLPAYRMKPDCSWLIILGVHGGGDANVDWSKLQTPPVPGENHGTDGQHEVPG